MAKNGGKLASGLFQTNKEKNVASETKIMPEEAQEKEAAKPSAQVSPDRDPVKPARRQGRPRAADLKENEKVIRAAYYITEDVDERLRFESYKTKRDHSEIIRRLVREHLPKE